MKLLIHSQTSTVQPLRFGMDNYFHLTLNRACNYFSILGSKLIHVSPWSVARTHVNLVGHFEWYSLISGNDIRDHRCSVVSPVPVDVPALPIKRASARTVMTTFSPIYIPAHEGLFSSHYSGVIMSAMASQITSLTIVYSTVYSKKTPKLRITGLCDGNSPVIGEFPAQKASNAEDVSIWWHHHEHLLQYWKTSLENHSMKRIHEEPTKQK